MGVTSDVFARAQRGRRRYDWDSGEEWIRVLSVGDQIRSDSLARMDLLHWTLSPQHPYAWLFLQEEQFERRPGLETGSEQPVGRETAVQTPGKRIP